MADSASLWNGDRAAFSMATENVSLYSELTGLGR